MSQSEATASSMLVAIRDNHALQLIKIERIDPDTGAVPTAFQRLLDISQLIKIERINRVTGEPVAGIYNE